MRFVLVGGGTGGHFYPLIAVAEALRDRDRELNTSVDLVYMGPNVYNADVLKENGIRFSYCPAGKQRLYFSPLNFFDKFVTLFGIVVAFWKLFWLYPDAVMSKGGFTSVPVVIAAWLLRIPIVIHESDAVPGRANLLVKKMARYIGIAHDDAATYFPKETTAQVGMPIRKAFFNKVADPFVVNNIPKDKPVVLVTGGSLGAERLNNFVLAALPKLLPDYTVFHQAGDAHQAKVAEDASTLIQDISLLNRYFVFGHLDQAKFAAAEQAASVIVSRAGSSAIFEIALLGKPSVLVPIPEDVSRDQRTNAYSYARTGAATVLEEKNLSDDILVAEIRRILEDKEVYDHMSQAALGFTVGNAAYTLADIIRNIGQEHE